ncbi:bifunctional 23S rRNA (guanine(2069)-N(7))-methyltransferase RlmK/23S rRNA (guanine(2445)-N(2))-methyltransferase RlmL [Nannocystaceae bacterium ST9]
MSEPLEFFVTAPHGAEDLLVDELRALGIETKPRVGGTSFRGTLEDGMRAALWLRTASRLLLELAELPAEDGDRLYAAARTIDWTEQLEPGATFAVQASGTGHIDNSHFAALRVKDAIVDQLRERWGERPDVDIAEPDLALRVHLRGDRARLSLDLGGEGLHRRGYRVEQGAAPLRENLAAAVLLRAGWTGEGTLLDPFCGSATLLIEAAWLAADVAPGLQRRRWGFTRWPGRDEATWKRLVGEAERRRSEGLARLAGRSPLLGFDADSRTIRAAIACIEAAGLRGRVHVERRELADLVAPAGEPGLIVCNPPWGERIGTRRELERLYASFGALLRERFVGWEVALLAGDPGLGRFLGMTAHRRNVLHDGPIAAQILRIHVEPAGPPRPPPEAKPRSEGAAAFANRLHKNRKKLASWLEREGVGCYRLYDADIPEYNLALDLYRVEPEGSGPGESEPLVHAHVQEYAPPRQLDPEKARLHLREALAVIREDLELPRERVHLKRRERQRGRSQYEKLDQAGQEFVVREGPARFLVNFEDYLDSGLFLDHRPLRARLRELAADKRMLNLFCYTATASIHAALGGARSTTSVDLSRTYLEWAERNFALNRMPVAQAESSHGPMARHRLLRADVIDWLSRPSHERWDLIFCDPPSYSNSKRMQHDFDVQRDHPDLIARCLDRLAPGGLLVFSTNLRSFELAPRRLASDVEIEDWTKPSIPKDFERSERIHRCFLLRRR